MEQLLNVKEVAQFTRLHKSTIYRFVKEGKFPKPIKIGSASRWKKEDLVSYLDASSST